jgi:hypothetical protein
MQTRCLGLLHLTGFVQSDCNNANVALKRSSSSVVCQPWFYLRLALLRPTALSGYPRGHRVLTETDAAHRLRGFAILTLEPRRSGVIGYHQRESLGMERDCPRALRLFVLAVSWRRSSLPSSKLLARRRRSCVPASVVPWVVRFPSLAIPGSSSVAVLGAYWR